VFDVRNDYRLLPNDTQYGDRSVWASLDPSGSLVTTCYDGYVRLYGSGQYARPVASYHAQGKPFSALFSPDGQRVAVGLRDMPKVIVLSGSALVPLFEPNVAGAHGTLDVVGWSDDGRSLFGGGIFLANNVEQVRRWEEGGKGAFVDIPAARDTIMDFVPLHLGTMLFASTASFGVIHPNSQVNPLRRLGVLALNSGTKRELRIARDGGTVQIDAQEPRHS
jgi:hypothetical protein